MAKGVPINKEKSPFESLFIGSHKTRRIAEHLTAEQQPSSPQQTHDNRDYELMRLRIIQEELERRMRKYEKTVDFYQYSLILIVVLLMIKMIVDEVKK